MCRQHNSSGRPAAGGAAEGPGAPAGRAGRGRRPAGAGTRAGLPCAAALQPLSQLQRWCPSPGIAPGGLPARDARRKVGPGEVKQGLKIVVVQQHRRRLLQPAAAPLLHRSCAPATAHGLSSACNLRCALPALVKGPCLRFQQGQTDAPLPLPCTPGGPLLRLWHWCFALVSSSPFCPGPCPCLLHQQLPACRPSACSTNSSGVRQAEARLR